MLTEQMKAATERCPHCQQRMPKPKAVRAYDRICRNCRKPIHTHHKWKCVTDGIDLRIRQKSYHQGALKRNLPWQLSREEFRKLLADSCLYCGLTPSNGVDRRDNSKGYTHENSVPCCAQCNYAKRHQTEAEFLNWVSRIAAKQGFSL